MGKFTNDPYAQLGVSSKKEGGKNDNIKVTKKGNIKTTNIGYFF